MFVTYPDVLQPGLGGLRAGVRVRVLALRPQAQQFRT